MKNYLKNGTLPVDIAIALVAIASWLSIIFPTYMLVITCAAGFITVAGCGLTILSTKPEDEPKVEDFSWTSALRGAENSSEALQKYLATFVKASSTDVDSYRNTLKAIENGSIYSVPKTLKSIPDDFHLRVYLEDNKIRVVNSVVETPSKYKSSKELKIFENEGWMQKVNLVH